MERTCPKCGSQIVGQKNFLLRPKQKEEEKKKKKSDFEEAIVWFLGLSPKHEIVFSFFHSYRANKASQEKNTTTGCRLSKLD